MTVLSDGDDDPVVPAGDAGRVPLPAHQNQGYKLRATFTDHPYGSAEFFFLSIMKANSGNFNYGTQALK